eukprot:646479-Karenia_brevis.AAC.1
MEFAEVVAKSRENFAVNHVSVGEVSVERLQSLPMLQRSFKQTKCGKAADWAGMRGDLLRYASEEMGQAYHPLHCK